MTVLPGFLPGLPVGRDRTDRAALGAWALSRVGVGLLAAAGAWFIQAGRAGPGFLARWNRWDTSLLIEIARFGYAGNPAEKPDPGLPAFFPGMPLALRAVHALLPDWTLAGLLISLVAGAVATVALARLGEWEGPAGTGPRAVLALLLAPSAVFLFAGYTEALFLAFALPAWLAARRGRWGVAVTCAAAAASVRITGLFLACALVAMFACDRERSPWRRAPLLVVPFLPVAAYATYQWWRVGDWLAWLHAQQAGWGRHLVPPWRALATTWDAAFHIHNEFTWAFRAELAGAAVGVALTLWLARRRRWPELVYVGGQVAALVTSSFYLSIPRAALLWWPLWLVIARAGARRPWLFAGYVAVAAPLMAVFVLTFTSGAWAG